jgi:2-keto-4-pentenoate hydratase
MMDHAIAGAAARTLWHAWSEAGVIEGLSEACRPTTRAEGYAVQSAWLALAGRPVAGWKIAATSLAGQAHIGVDGPLAGPILADRVHPSGSAVSLAGNRMRLAEVEFAFRIARSLPPRAAPYQAAEVIDAVDALLPSIELPDSRFVEVARAGAPQLIADCACAWRFVPGIPADDSWRSLDLSTQTATADVGGRYGREGVGSNVLGDPRTALTWLVNELSAHGRTLEAGQFVTTGTCLAPLPVQEGDHLRVDFGKLGKVDVRFIE